MPSAGGNSPAQVAVLEERIQHILDAIDGLNGRVEARMDDITRRLDGLDARMVALERCQTRDGVEQSSRLDAAWRRIDEHSAALAASAEDRKHLGLRVSQVEDRLRLVYWLMGLIGATTVVAIVGGVLNLVMR